MAYCLPSFLVYDRLCLLLLFSFSISRSGLLRAVSNSILLYLFSSYFCIVSSLLNRPLFLLL
ncbi:hypothetical protein BDW67DRAFT_83074 [Aspergillus spinulosporus]